MLYVVKGLEFLVVFLIGMEEGIFLLFWVMMDEDELEEEWWLVYVGIMWVEKKLYLINVYLWMFYGWWQNNLVFCFVEEIELELFKNENMLDGVSSIGFKVLFGVDCEWCVFIFLYKKNLVGMWVMVKKVSGMGVDKNSWLIGDKVKYCKWGIGMVVKVFGVGEDVELDIVFKFEGIKWLLVVFVLI